MLEARLPSTQDYFLAFKKKQINASETPEEQEKTLESDCQLEEALPEEDGGVTPSQTQKKWEGPSPTTNLTPFI